MEPNIAARAFIQTLCDALHDIEPNIAARAFIQILCDALHDIEPNIAARAFIQILCDALYDIEPETAAETYNIFKGTSKWSPIGPLYSNESQGLFGTILTSLSLTSM